VWASGTGPSCYANNTGGKLFDMSGNLNEWTSTVVMSGTTTYYKLRGGAFNSPTQGLSCGFDFDIAQAGFANSDVGFRCCADHAP
jgi:formylglycine-generating enzyme required for sulfatase activity